MLPDTIPNIHALPLRNKVLRKLVWVVNHDSKLNKLHVKNPVNKSFKIGFFTPIKYAVIVAHVKAIKLVRMVWLKLPNPNRATPILKKMQVKTP